MTLTEELSFLQRLGNYNRTTAIRESYYVYSWSLSAGYYTIPGVDVARKLVRLRSGDVCFITTKLIEDLDSTRHTYHKLIPLIPLPVHTFLPNLKASSRDVVASPSELTSEYIDVLFTKGTNRTVNSSPGMEYTMNTRQLELIGKELWHDYKCLLEATAESEIALLGRRHYF